jgi:hypothetical protein
MTDAGALAVDRCRGAGAGYRSSSSTIRKEIDNRLETCGRSREKRATCKVGSTH